jgi:signal transduction histidine kinase
MQPTDDRLRPGSDTTRRLARTARHDLRGALNALHLHVQLLAATDEDPAPEARDRRAEHATVIRDACRSVCALLPLVVEPLPAPPDAEAVTVAALVAHAVEHLQPIAFVRGVTIHADARSPMRIGGDEAGRRLDMLVGMLLDALEAAPRGCTIQLDVDHDRSRACVTSPSGDTVELALNPDDG